MPRNCAICGERVQGALPNFDGNLVCRPPSECYEIAKARAERKWRDERQAIL